MTSYYLLQHILLALGLALCALAMPRFFHLAALTRALLGASLTPQVIGLVVMLLALLGVRESSLYIYGPGALATLMLVIAAVCLSRSFWRRLGSFRITPAGIVLTIMGGGLAIQLGSILYDNALTLNVLSHDFNVYMNSAKAFAIAPGVGSMPSFYGTLGEVIVVHPHSFIYEAYLAHALMLGGSDLSFPPLDFLPRLGQQLTLVYMLLAIAGVSVSMSKRWTVVASVAMTLCVPWVYYISESLSRDAFRMAPLFGLIVIMGSLGLNFSSALIKRGLLAGAYAALAVMSHTMGLMLSFIIGASVLAYVLMRRRPTLAAVGAYLIPLVLVGSLSVLRYVQNYFETGEFMGFGLQYSIYKGTWLEPLIAKSWVDSGGDWLNLLKVLLHQYDIRLQLAALGIAVLAVLFSRERGRSVYLILLVAMWAPLLLAVSGILSYKGINLRNALAINFRYPLSFFLLSAPLLVAGVARLGTSLTGRLHLQVLWRQLAVVTVTGLAVFYASESLSLVPWRTIPSTPRTISNIKALHQATECLGSGQHWFVDNDVLNVYFIDHPPLFAFTAPARPLLMASAPAEVEAVLHSTKLKYAVFFENSAHWKQGSFYHYLEAHWERFPMKGDYKEHEVWAAPDVAKCINGKF